MDSVQDDRPLRLPGFPIRTSTDRRSRTTPRSFSQLTTSFIACACQGIHQTPLKHLIALITQCPLPIEQRFAQLKAKAGIANSAAPVLPDRQNAGKTSVTRDMSVSSAVKRCKPKARPLSRASEHVFSSQFRNHAHISPGFFTPEAQVHWTSLYDWS